MELCQSLIHAGPEHRKFLRQIFVSVDITAPLYFWKEFDTYKVRTVANSCSTMYTIHKKEFEPGDFSWEHLFEIEDVIDSYKSFKEEPAFVKLVVNDTDCTYTPKQLMLMTCQTLNHFRKLYLETNNNNYWWQMIQLLPSSYNQKRTVTLNYENLLSIYNQRCFHKLDEWREGFCEWIKTLPYADELIMFDWLAD